MDFCDFVSLFCSSSLYDQGQKLKSEVCHISLILLFGTCLKRRLKQYYIKSEFADNYANFLVNEY